MKLFDPTVNVPNKTNKRAEVLPNLDGKVIGLLENGKLNAANMLEETAKIFEKSHNCSIEAIYRKDNPSAPAPAELLFKVANHVDFLITGLGD